ncbi:serine--pyruvate aminotransferase-like [Anoplophora glabripennis]|uniref:serine--pyruvate aminotransferase-like n=1 Tax=Anoplophora glabripennis TaxID=217634 RepID=UPI0008750BA1|nr:serine--pyruvate aminotransferase-like [Anoplophora glabripennis]
MSVILDVPNPYKSGPIFRLTPFRLFGAGPSNCSPNVLQAMTFQPFTAFNRTYFELSKEIKEMTQYVYQTKNPMTFLAQYSGNGGNEAMITNLADPGDTIIVAQAGIWGFKVADMGRRYKLNVIELTLPAGEVYSFEELEKQIIKHKPVALFMTHGESSGGILQPLEGLGKICQKYNCLLSVDAVVSVGVSPLFVDRWEIDAVCGGTQKGLGAPPGMVLMSFNKRAHERMLKKKERPPYILDMLVHADVWRCFETSGPTYIYTFNTNMFAAVRQALAEICEEGIENVWKRHQDCSDLFIKKTEKLGIRHFIEKPENRFCGVNCVTLPEDVDWHEFCEYLLSKHEIELGMGIGPTLDKAIRIGFLAQNAKPDLVEFVVNALEDGIRHCRSKSGTFDVHSSNNLFVFYTLKSGQKKK